MAEEQIVNSLSPYVRAVMGAPTTSTVEFLGSGWLLEHHNNVLLVTAAHVTDRVHENYPIFVDSLNDRLVQVAGEIFASPTNDPSRRKDDKHDVAIVRLEPSAVAKLSDTPRLKIQNLDLTGESKYENGFIALGYPITKNKKAIDGSNIRPEIYCLHSMQADQSAYQALGVTDKDHIVIHFNKKAVFSSSQEKRAAPNLNGLSGTPIWGSTESNEAKVFAVLTEHHQGSIKAILGTKVTSVFKMLKI